MSKFYIISGEYQENSAPYNRLLSFLNVFESQGIDIELVYLYPNWQKTKPNLSHFQHIRVSYLYETPIPLTNRIVAKLCTSIIIRRLKRRLCSGDKVFVFDGSIVLSALTEIKNIYVYHETTEHPDVMIWRIKRWKTRYLNACKKLSGLFVISTSLKNFFVGIGVTTERITIVNMTVDPHRFDGVVKDKTTEKYIAYCGTASNNKDGVNKLIEAFGIVAKRHHDVKLYIIGKTPSAEDKSGNLQLVESLGIKDRVVFTGVVPAEKMPQILTNASVLALARPDNLQAQNGFPTKLGEYLLTGNPVVVTGVGDIPLYLKDGESALIAEPGNLQGFADKLCWVLEHENEAAKIGLRGRGVAEHHFDSRKETQKIINTIFE